MQFIYVEFYDLVYSDGWGSEKLEYADSIHTGIGILIEDKPTHIIIAMAVGNNPEQPFSKLLIPREMMLNSVIIDGKSFTDRILINGYGEMPSEEKTCDCNNK